MRAEGTCSGRKTAIPQSAGRSARRSHPDRGIARTPIMAAPPPTNLERASVLSQLLARTALADQAAFSELYRRTSAQLYAVALRILRDRGLTEEIVQEAYVSVWHNAGTYDAAKSQPLTWLVSIVR